MKPGSILFQKVNRKATPLYMFTNSIGDNVVLYEDPEMGEEAPVIVAFVDEEVAFSSTFFDTDDLVKNSDYEPLYVEGRLMYGYEM